MNEVMTYLRELRDRVVEQIEKEEETCDEQVSRTLLSLKRILENTRLAHAAAAWVAWRVGGMK